MIEVTGLTKSYGAVRAVDALSFTAPAGRITGFLGPNGSGKTTTLRMLLGLVKPSSGLALIGGCPYRELRDPLCQVGAVLEQGVAHPGQTGRAHLRTQAMFVGVGAERVERLLDLVGLSAAAGRRVGGYSLGMRQRLAVATALIGDPAVLVLDEPANGLDPEGIAWLRGLLRNQADAGRTVLISSHLLAELAQTVDEVVVIAEGRLVRQAPLAELAATGPACLRIRVDDPDRLFNALAQRGAVAERDGAHLRVPGLTSEELGYVAHTVGVVVYELSTETADLEQAFLTLVRKP